MTCKDCKFFRLNASLVSGDCRRYPPLRWATSMEGNTTVTFTQTISKEWCGEFMGVTNEEL